MEKRTYKKTGEEISLLGFGNMRLPTLPGEGDAIDYDAAKTLIDAALAGGINYFDTAWGYHGGGSEPFIGKALAGVPRGSYFLATKLPMWLINSREDAIYHFEQQLERCQTDYFDFYLFHAMNRGTVSKIKDFGLWDLMDDYRKQGKIRNLGFSFHDSPEVLQQLCDDYKWDFAQLQLNYLDWEQQDAKQQYEILEKHGIPCTVMEPVHGGSLADLGEKANAVLKAANPNASIASWAFRWLAGLPNLLVILSGMNTPAQVEENLQTFSPLKPLDADEQKALEQALTIYRQSATVPCTGCRYCMPCPMGVDIPAMLALYNQCAFDNDTIGFKHRYKLFEAEHNAHNCVACGQCEGACPQRLPIIETLAKIVSMAE